MSDTMAMSLLDSGGGIYVVYSSDGLNWSIPWGTRLFGSWVAHFTPSLASFGGTLYMCLSDTSGHIYVTTYDEDLAQWNQPGTALFDGGSWQTFWYITPNIVSSNNLTMYLLDVDAHIWTSVMKDDGTWPNPTQMYSDWQTAYSPTIASGDSGAYMCITDTSGRIYLSTYDQTTNMFPEPAYVTGCLFSGYETYKNRTPNIIDFNGTLYLALSNSEGVLNVASFDGSNWTGPSQIFGNWATDFSPTFGVFEGSLFMCLCDSSGRIYISELVNGSWTQPTYKQSNLWAIWETYLNITPVVCDTLEAEVASSQTLTTWMGDISDATSIGQISIPGTHDSAAIAPWGGAMTICQGLTIAQQLNIGVRYLDVRCQLIDNKFALHHGIVYLHQMFGDAMQACTDFLTAHPTECIIMAVSEHGDPIGSSASFQTIFLNYVFTCQSFWYLGTTIPTLGDVRGKIILLRRFATDAGNVMAMGWDGNNGWDSDVSQCTVNLPNGQKLIIQDHAEVKTLFDIGGKWTMIENQLTQALRNPSSSTVYLNYTSGASTGAYPDAVAKGPANRQGENQRLIDFLAVNPIGCYGTIVMDFPEYPDGVLTSQIIRSNNTVTSARPLELL